MNRVWDTTMPRSAGAAADGIASFHRELLTKYASGKPSALPTPAWVALQRFNGMYALSGSGTAPSAFFSIDANIVYANGVANTDISLIVSLDGATSQRVPFTGTFDGQHLVQAATASGFGVELTLSRPQTPPGVMAACSGTITPANGSPIQVSGVTYNNPIPYEVFEGTYYPSSFTSGEMQSAAPVVKIAPDYQLFYDNGGGPLTPVESYVYNVNMYYFAFGPNQSTNLIMGTAGAKGLACNNMYLDASGGLQTRSLATIPNPQTGNSPKNGNANTKALSDLSGFYQLPSIAPGAFLSILGQYQFAAGVIVGYSVNIGLSLDGTTSCAYTFDDTMTFQNGTLTIPNVLEVKIARNFDPEGGTLSTLVGTISGTPSVSGYNYFNPVPLSAFGGATMTTSAGTDPLEVQSDTALSFKTKPMEAGVYVPLMYIVAGLTGKDEWFMSFGSGGQKGNACIVTSVPPATTVVVSAIPNA